MQFLLFALAICVSVRLTYQQATGYCPGGVQSLPLDCDPKHPWPRCPPQTYCYATNSVDIGPYYCCPAGGNNVPQPTSAPQPAPAIQPIPEPSLPVQPMQPMQPMQPIQPISQVTNNYVQSSYYSSTSMPNPYPSQQVNGNGWNNVPSYQVHPMMSRKPSENEDSRRISNSINQWLEKQQQ
ncbi:unnamed protein product [Cylicocyclus nassatus]|uniref:Uncharacterized protein n=1 Tax=Cylicocyclus nassatus TaxID=53992 RepID=A0AA36MCJ7_CYLNA|nr:unnamed protein product [Cylicocyclus nassatus]